jgi:hypothetical protein
MQKDDIDNNQINNNYQINNSNNSFNQVSHFDDIRNNSEDMNNMYLPNQKKFNFNRNLREDNNNFDSY